MGLCGLMLFGSWSRSAWGHTFPYRTEPLEGATVTVSPARVRLWFSGTLNPSQSTIRVQNGKGQPVDKGDGRVDPSNRTLLNVSLPPLSPGTYRVIWSVVGSDGHQAQGDYTFTLRKRRR